MDVPKPDGPVGISDVKGGGSGKTLHDLSVPGIVTELVRTGRFPI